MTTPGYPVPERGALFAGREVVELPLRRRAAACCPTSTRVDWTGVGAAVAQLPEQPDRRRPRRSSSTSAAAALGARARLRRWPATRPTPSSSSAARRPARRCSWPTARNVVVLNTLSKRSSMPGYRSGFVAGDPDADRRAQALPAQRRRRAAGVRPARRDRRLGRRGARRRRCARATAPSATCCCPRCEAAGLAPRGRRRDVLPVAAPPATARRRRGVRRRAARATGVVRRARLVLRRRRAQGYLRLALVRRRSPSAARGGASVRAAQSVGVQGGVEAAPAARCAAPASTAPVWRVAAEQQAAGARQLARLDDLAVGQRHARAGGDVEAGLDDAVVAERDARGRRWRRAGSARRSR